MLRIDASNLGQGDDSYDLFLKNLQRDIRSHFSDVMEWMPQVGSPFQAAIETLVNELAIEAEGLNAQSGSADEYGMAKQIADLGDQVRASAMAQWRDKIRKRDEALKALENLRSHFSEEDYEQIRVHFLAMVPEPQVEWPDVTPADARDLLSKGLVATQLLNAIHEALDRASRSLTLLRLSHVPSSNQRVRAYMERCGRSFVLGAFDATVVMACAAIEQHLEERTSKKAVAEQLGLKAYQVRLGHRARYLEQKGLVAQPLSKRLLGLIGQRNDIIHVTPRNVQSSEEALAALEIMRDVLVALPIV